MPVWASHSWMSFTFASQTWAAPGVPGSSPEEMGIMFEVGAAAAGIGDDGVELAGGNWSMFRRARSLGLAPFSIMGVKRTAAALEGRGDHPAPVPSEYLRRVPIDREQRSDPWAHPVSRATRYFRGPRAGRTGGMRSAERAPLDPQGHGLQFPRRFGRSRRSPLRRSSD